MIDLVDQLVDELDTQQYAADKESEFPDIQRERQVNTGLVDSQRPFGKNKTLPHHKTYKQETTNKGKDVEPRLPSVREVVLKQGDPDVLFAHFNRSQCHEYGNRNNVFSYLNRAEYRIEKQVAPCHISNNIEHIQEEEDTTHECRIFMSF